MVRFACALVALTLILSSAMLGHSEQAPVKTFPLDSVSDLELVANLTIK
jgi:hypothetical protein